MGTIVFLNHLKANHPQLLSNGSRAIKVDCKDEFQTGNKVDVSANLDKKSKLSFRGEIVKKQKVGTLEEYGIEVKEITESNSRLMHSCVGGVLE